MRGCSERLQNLGWVAARRHWRQQAGSRPAVAVEEEYQFVEEEYPLRKYRNQILSGDFAGIYRSHSLNAMCPKCYSGSLECTPPEALGDRGTLSPVKCRITSAFRNDAPPHHREKGWFVLERFAHRKP